MLKLIPVIEFEPSVYRHEKRSSPIESPAEAPQVWAKYWKDSLADSGMGELESFENSWFVETSKIVKEETIRKLIRGWIEEDGSLLPGDEIGSINGGYILQSDDNVILPQCCGDLADIENWQKAIYWQDEKWEEIWIGHPWAYVRYVEGKLEFTPHYEGNFENSLKILVAPKVFEDAFQEAQNALQLFRERLVGFLCERMSMKRANELADILLLGKYPEE